VLELGEGARVGGAGPAERQIVAGTAALRVGVLRELGFGGGGAVALRKRRASNASHARELGFGGGGAVALAPVDGLLEVSFYLTDGRHGGSGLGQTAGLSYIEDRAVVGGIRGVIVCK
jgi:hypothetical protein